VAGIHHHGSWQMRLHSIIIILLISEIVFPNIVWVDKRHVSSWPVATANNTTTTIIACSGELWGWFVATSISDRGVGSIENWSCMVNASLMNRAELIEILMA